jgi:HEAT repeat protein
MDDGVSKQRGRTESGRNGGESSARTWIIEHDDLKTGTQTLMDATAPVVEIDRSRMARTQANALGSAWATYQLYPDPRGRIGFDRALQDLADAPGLDYLEVGPQAFIWEGSNLHVTHAGTRRIVDRLFASNVAAIQFVSSPDADDLLALFEVLRLAPEALDDRGGATACLQGAGVHSIRLLERQLLSDEEQDDQEEPESDLTETTDRWEATRFSGDPGGLAAALLKAAGDDPSALASLVIDTYVRAHTLIDQQDIWNHEEMVHTFVDMFFFFPREYQAPLITGVLGRQHESPFRIFLDQFASHEINELAPFLDPSIHPLLLEYARIASENQDRSREIIDLLNEAGPEDSVDAVVGRRIQAVLAASSGDADAAGSRALARLTAQRPDSRITYAAGVGVVGRLLSVAESPAETLRVLRIWAGKTAQAIRDRNPDGALTWLQAVADSSSLAHSATGPASQALGEAIDSSIVADLVEVLHDPPDSMTANELLRRLAPHITGHLIELLGEEEDGHRRRGLLAMVVEASQTNADQVVAYLDDPRWYLVRNLAFVLGRSRQPELVPHVLPLTKHPDARVRREALRAIHSLTGYADISPYVNGLTDPDESVRKAAITVLRTCDDRTLVPMLETVLASPVDTDLKLDVVTLLSTHLTAESRDGTPLVAQARSALERLAQTGSGSRGANRKVRAAARQALEEAA